VLIAENSEENQKRREKARLMEEKNDAMNSPLESFNVMIESVSLFNNISLNIFLIFFSIILFFSYFNNRSIKKNIPLM